MVVSGECLAGESLWKGPLVPVCQKAPWEGLQNFRVVSLGPAVAGHPPLLLLLGGRRGSSYRNGVWRSRDGGVTWEEASAHEEGRSSGGRLIRTKWAGREGFAAAGGWTAQRGGMQALVYVVGGLGPVSPPYADVWVSEDLGRTFVRTCAEAPFGKRVSSGLAVCPGRPQRVVLVGGGWNDDVDHWDCWLSMDAGEHWTEVRTPSNDLQRRMPMVALPKPGVLLVFGGHNRRSPYPDMYVARLKWQEKQATWQSLEVYVGENAETMEEMPDDPHMPWFLNHFTTLDTRSGEFVGFTSGGRAAVGRLPPAAFRGSLPLSAEQARVHVSLRRAMLPRYPKGEALIGMPLHVALTADSLRLFVLAEDGVWATSPVGGEPPELRRQLELLGQVGRGLQAAHGLLEEVWTSVLAGLLGAAAARRPRPAAQLPKAVKAAPRRGAPTAAHALLAGPPP